MDDIMQEHNKNESQLREELDLLQKKIVSMEEEQEKNKEQHHSSGVGGKDEGLAGRTRPEDKNNPR